MRQHHRLARLTGTAAWVAITLLQGATNPDLLRRCVPVDAVAGIDAGIEGINGGIEFTHLHQQQGALPHEPAVGLQFECLRKQLLGLAQHRRQDRSAHQIMREHPALLGQLRADGSRPVTACCRSFCLHTQLLCRSTRFFTHLLSSLQS
ncbi:MAG: hypothetical protein K8F35_05185 [Dokdonella sp.]|uniref:hypothetical protein n=1 Tax=Dokdonella sp. TaxID=2291710 RepID=UPI0025C29439|nr:hypothetical protein [Dokdonella sp.]MBZ0222403.1 hypothetical protein [Dokdonella sp.]